MSHKNVNPVNAAHPKRVAIVLSNPGVSTTSGWPVGFWWSELTHPYFTFTGLGHSLPPNCSKAASGHTIE